MKSLQLAMVAAITFSLMQIGASECDGENIIRAPVYIYVGISRDPRT